MIRGLFTIFAVISALMGRAQAAESALPRLEWLIPVIERGEPLTLASVNSLLGTALHCEDGRCVGKNVVLGALRIKDVDFRARKLGSLLILEGLDPTCLRQDRVEILYPSGTVTMGCTDGVTCFYSKVKRPWGTLSFGLSPDLKPTSCVTSVIFDTFH